MKFHRLKQLIFSSTAKSTYIISSADMTLAVLAAVTTALVARELSPSEFGTFIALWTFNTLIASLLDLGIGSGIINFVSQTKNPQIQNRYISTMFIFLNIIGLIQFLIFSLGAHLWQNLLFPKIDPSWLIIVSLGAWFLLLGKFSNDSLRAKQQFIHSGFATATFAILRLTFIIYLIYSHNFDLFKGIIIMSLSPSIYLALSFFSLRLPLRQINFHLKYLKQVLKFSSWLGFNQVVTTSTSRVDILLLNRLASSTSAGIYGTASLIARVYTIITGSLLAVLAPKLIQLKNKTQQKKFLLKIFFLTLLVSSSILIVIALARPLILIIFGSEYLDAIPILYLLVTAMGALVISVPVLLPIIYILKKPNIIAWLSTLQLTIVLIANLIFIPKYGMIAPAYILIFSQILVLFIATGYLKKKYLNT